MTPAQQLVDSLGLKTAPVAVTFLDAPPANMPRIGKVAFIQRQWKERRLQGVLARRLVRECPSRHHTDCQNAHAMVRAKTKQVVQIADITLERGYIEGDPFVVSAVTLGGYRGVLTVPMLHEDKLIGVIAIFRQEVGQVKPSVSLHSPVVDA